MSDMVEKVARAIYDAEDTMSGDAIAVVLIESEHLYPKPEHYVEDAPTSEAYQLAAMELCRTAARAVLECLRTPTPEMVKAGLASVSGYPRPEAVKAIFLAMIDAALSPNPTSNGEPE